MMSKSWNERGRPTEFEEIVGQKNFTDDAKNWQSNDSYPEALLFVGQSGVGKTTAARVIAKQMLGKAIDCDFYECNASDERGIDFIRVFLKTAAQTSPYMADRKVILLDEADGLTPAAQDALRQIVENSTSNCLFIFTANDESKIRPAIKSRCVIYKFKAVDSEEGAKHLTNVCEKMGVPERVLSEWGEYFPRLVTYMGGDLRACVSILESLHMHDLYALKDRVSDFSGTSQAALSAVTCEWMDMRVQFHKALSHGRDRFFVMRSFYQNLSSLFDMDEDDKVWTVLDVYGDMMTKIYEWPDSDQAFLDYFVAKLRKEMKQNE
ncbi:MAG: AAA family ATPase [Candidatus Peribacter sp.]|jgi:DNA polymerase III delta prime subunit|nr:AAA family ATPase [Candidatus Peribacter sp.]